jgi:hypothetical protein
VKNYNVGNDLPGKSEFIFKPAALLSFFIAGKSTVYNPYKLTFFGEEKFLLQE